MPQRNPLYHFNEAHPEFELEDKHLLQNGSDVMDATLRIKAKKKTSEFYFSKTTGYIRIANLLLKDTGYIRIAVLKFRLHLSIISRNLLSLQIAATMYVSIIKGTTIIQ